MNELEKMMNRELCDTYKTDAERIAYMAGVNSAICYFDNAAEREESGRPDEKARRAHNQVS